MTKNEQTQHVEEQANAAGEQLKGRVEQVIAGMTGDQQDQAHGLLDEAKGKLLAWKDKLQRPSE